MYAAQKIRTEPSPFRRRVVLSLLVLVAVGGCGQTKSKNELAVFPVSGTVSFDGNPLPGANVTLIPIVAVQSQQRIENPYACGGLTDEKGQFVLTTYKLNDGAPEGEYAVTVSCENRQKSRGRGEFPEMLPRHYQSPVESKLTATISKGKNELPEFVLVSESR